MLCNLLVCLALWMAAAPAATGPSSSSLWWALLAFIGSGFEHSIANVTTLRPRRLDGAAPWHALLRNLAWTVPGNIVGGGVLVGLAYSWLGGRTGSPSTRTATAPSPAVAAAPAPAPVPAGAAAG